MKIHLTHIEWGEHSTGEYQYYFWWFNWLKKERRFCGLKHYYYDGPHATFGFWFFNMSWSTHWTKCV